MDISRIEFDDKDDPESSVHHNSPIRFNIAPEGMVLCLPNSKGLTSDDQTALAKMLRMAYEQGKRVGAARPAEGK